MNYQESLEYIHNINWTFCNPGLERISLLCERLGHPEKALKCIHVGGTNGKGSFCAMTESILRAAGYRTGLFTSPYIRFFNERMQVMGEPISNEELAEITSYVRPIADSMEDKPTEFELITAIAFEYFRRQKTDVVVLEVGLGGRLDSTNIIKEPLLSVITGIAFDHMGILGNTLSAIAGEKAGIIKTGCPVLWGGESEEAADVICRVAAERKAPLVTVDRSCLQVKDYRVEGTVFDYDVYEGLHLSLLGTYQPYNAATVLTGVAILNRLGLSISEKAVREGLSSVYWPARFELLSRDPLILYDGGHNPQGVAAAVESIRTYFPGQRVDLLSGVMADKNYDEMIALLRPVSRRVFTVTPNNPRALQAEAYAEMFAAQGVEACGYPTVREGLSAAIAHGRADGVPLICLGSLYLYAELRSALEALL